MPAIRVTPIRSLVANAYLLQADRTVLVDTGNPGNAPRILQAMNRAGVRPRDLALILLTHGHLDHFGSIHELVAATGARSLSMRRTREP